MSYRMMRVMIRQQYVLIMVIQIMVRQHYALQDDTNNGKTILCLIV